MGSETLRFVIKAKDEASGALRGVGGSFSGMSAQAKKGIATVLVALVALTGAAIHFGDQFETAFNKIRINTGETGAALDGLKGDFDDVVKTVPTDFASASTAIADLNTRLGLTGPTLQAVSTQFLNLSKITGTDVAENIRLGTRLFGDWSIASKDQADAMDLVFRATQKSGIGLADLMQTVVSFGAPLRNMGFEFGESVAMLAKWEKEGVNTSTVLTGMKFALKTFARAGKEPQAALEKLIPVIRDTKNEQKAMALGMQTFGLRAGPDMVAAIREGRFEYADFAKQIATGTDTIAKARKDTLTWHDSLQLLKNQSLVKLEPLLIKMTSGLMRVIDAFAKLPTGLQAVIAGMTVLATVLLGAALAIGPLVGLGGALSTAYGLLAGAAGAAAVAQGALTAAQVSGSIATGVLLGETTALRTALPLMSAAGIAAFAAIAIPAGALLWKLKDIHDETMSIYDDVDQMSDQVTKQLARLTEMQRARPEGVKNAMTRKIQDQIMKVTIQTHGEGDLTKLEAKMDLFKRFAKFEYPGFSSLTLDIKAGKIKGADLVYTFEKLRTDIMRQLHMTEKQADTILRGIFGKKYKPLKVPRADTSAWRRLPTELERNTKLIVKVAKRDGEKAGRDLMEAFRRHNKPAPYSLSAARAAQAIREKMDTLPGYGSALGANLANSVAAGISSATSTVALRAEQMVRTAMARANAAADAHSPSRKMMTLGGYIAEGLAVGITAGTKQVVTSATNLALVAANALRAGLGKASSSKSKKVAGAAEQSGAVQTLVDFIASISASLDLLAKTTVPTLAAGWKVSVKAIVQQAAQVSTVIAAEINKAFPWTKGKKKTKKREAVDPKMGKKGRLIDQAATISGPLGTLLSFMVDTSNLLNQLAEQAVPTISETVKDNVRKLAKAAVEMSAVIAAEINAALPKATTTTTGKGKKRKTTTTGGEARKSVEDAAEISGPLGEILSFASNMVSTMMTIATAVIPQMTDEVREKVKLLAAATVKMGSDIAAALVAAFPKQATTGTGNKAAVVKSSGNALQMLEDAAAVSSPLSEVIGLVSNTIGVLQAMTELDPRLLETPTNAFSRLGAIIRNMATTMTAELQTIIVPDAVLTATDRLKQLAEAMLSVLAVMKEVSEVDAGSYGAAGWKNLMAAAGGMVTAAGTIGLDTGGLGVGQTGGISAAVMPGGGGGGDIVVQIDTVYATTPEQAAAAGHAITAQVVRGLAQTTRQSGRAKAKRKKRR